MSTSDREGSESGGHSSPAVADWPRGYGEASWWPIVTAMGVVGIYLGVGLYVVGRGESPVVDAELGIPTFAAGLVVFVGGLYGWLYHAFVRYYWSRSRGKSGGLRLATLLFLGTEVATFGGGFVYYAFVRLGPWPPGELPELLSSLVLVNTALLVTSSVTLHVAEESLEEGNRRRFVALLGLTFVLGATFLAGQAVEYYTFVVDEGFTLASGPFSSAFFGLTGLHGLHVSLGVVLLGTLLGRALLGQYSPDRHTSVTTVSLYWHFVDGVWILLVTVLYVGATL